MPCLRCGHCCKYFQYIDLNNESVREWVEARLEKSDGKIIQESETHIEYRIPFRCPHLCATTWGNEENKYVCGKKPKPHSCKIFPHPNMKKNLERFGLSFNKSVGETCGFREV